MTLNNVSVVMAPNIFMFKGFRSKISEQQEFSLATGIANIVRLLIRYQNLLWTVRPLPSISPFFHPSIHHPSIHHPTISLFPHPSVLHLSIYLSIIFCVPDPQVHHESGEEAECREPEEDKQGPRHEEDPEEDGLRSR